MSPVPDKKNKIIFTISFLVLCLLSCTAGNGKRAMELYLKAADLYDSGDFASAFAVCQEALDYDKKFTPALVLGGKAAFFEAEPEMAISCFLKASRIRPEAQEPLIWLARVYRFDGEAQKASSLCEKIIENNPSCISGWRLLASIAEDDADIASSLLYLNQAVSAAGEAGLAFLDRGSVRWAIGDRSGSISDLEAAIAVFPPASPYANHARELLSRILESE